MKTEARTGASDNRSFAREIDVVRELWRLCELGLDEDCSRTVFAWFHLE